MQVVGLTTIFQVGADDFLVFWGVSRVSRESVESQLKVCRVSRESVESQLKVSRDSVEYQ